MPPFPADRPDDPGADPVPPPPQGRAAPPAGGRPSAGARQPAGAGQPASAGQRAGEKRWAGARQWAGIALAGAIGVAASMGLYAVAAGWQARVAELRFAGAARDHLRTINAGLADATGVLWSLRAYFESRRGEVAPGEFQAFSASLRERAPGLRDTGWAPRVTARGRAAFEAPGGNGPAEGRTIKQRAPDGSLARAAEREEYFPILYSEPGDPNRPVAGFDLASEAARNAAIARARATGRPAATPPLRLANVQRPNGGVMGFIAVREGTAEPGQEPETAGIVLGAFETGRMIADILENRLRLADLDLCVLDPAAPPGDRLIYWHAADGKPPPAEQALLSGRHWQGTLDLIDQHWSAVFVPSAAYDDADASWTALAALACGLAMTASAAAYLRSNQRRTRKLERLADNLRRTTGELVRNSFKLDHMASHDGLTGLANRLRFLADVGALLRRAPEEGRAAAVLYLDLDRFKAVNDTLGHPVGDKLLQAVAARLRASVRPNDTVARLGGDEFAIAQSPARLDEGQPVAAEALSRRLVEAIARPYDIDGHRISIGVSIGFALAAPGETDTDRLLRRADLALYVSKREGRGTFRAFDPAMEAAATAEQGLEGELREALQRGELVAYFQPQVATATGRLRGFEALLRWHHPARGLVMPGDFMRCAEESGLIEPIGSAMLAQALAAAREWPPDVQVAVNLSPGQIARDGFAAAVQAALAESGQPGSRLVLEVTESALASHHAKARDGLHRLRALGVQVAMDDCGTGPALLGHLRSFPFDRIKIDQSFVAAMMESPQGLAVVQGILQAAAALGIAATAEGVETAAQLDQLAAYGCQLAQGFLFSPARPAAALPGIIARPFPAASREALQRAAGRRGPG